MPKPQCLIDLKLAVALNQFLYAAGMHKEAYKELGFRCPICKELVRPHKKAKNGMKAHFEHLEDKGCKG